MNFDFEISRVDHFTWVLSLSSISGLTCLIPSVRFGIYAIVPELKDFLLVSVCKEIPFKS